ncbi:LOW QUALITY PROTEIN: nuclear pore membrane glycoprotein 210-like [Acropora millepora]|uniref:LOW QUALITY PROTEIN: nuclear pore membrane glycoprotein 210-like n=1 Tax=Acropora millepora TaxID=45264 RepID=UPI001CF57E05|nr:LOW QUALITY PROTEIN: nuclear pore membrane glycoprotein 210-like [Acropora millepora]
MQKHMAPNMASLRCLVFIALLHGFIHADQQQNTLNVPQVLLPYAPRGSVSTNFTLKAFQGCYQWLSSRPEVATIQPIYSSEEEKSAKNLGRKCAREAMVTAQARLPERQMTEILAEEEVTGMTLRSDVAVDNIHKIEILTTTRELLLGEPPEVCHIQAFDEEGNVFTSLEGIEFVWELKTVEGVGSVNAQSVLRFMLFEFSSYETSPEIYSLEEKGSRGSSIVLEPINTGTAIVKAKPKDKAFANVAPAQVKVIVQDNVMLKPAHDVYIVVNTSITYSVVRLRQGKVTVVPMPSSQFELRLSNTTVGQLDVKQSSVMGIQSGYTKVTLVDKNMLHIHTGHQPAAGIYVVEPAYLGFSIVPHPDWVLQVGVEYEVSVQIYNADDRKIFVSDNIHLSTSFPEAYFQLLWSSKNGSYHRVKTLQKTKRTVITAVYTSIEIPEKHTIHTFDRPISGKQEAEIFDPVVVIPEIVLFPWYPAAQKNVAEYKQFQYLLEPSGGSGTYIWTSSNTSVATVSTKGLVITTNAVGYSQIRASDTRNLANFGSSEVYVLEPKKMEFLPSVVEAQVGDPLSLPLAVASCISTDCRELHVFMDCRSLPLTYTFSDPSIFKLVEDSNDYDIVIGSCMAVRVIALRAGFTTLTVTYQYGDIILKAAATIGSYLPLRVLDPVEVSVVSLCSTKNLMLEGGPLPWIVDTSGYYEEVHPDPKKADEVSIGYDHTADYTVDHSGSYHFFHVICLKQGEQVLTVNIGNKRSAKNPYPASSSVKIRFVCANPASLTIVPDIKLPTVDGRQLSPENCVSSNKEFHVRNNQKLNLVAHLRDPLGRTFDNFTSLKVQWTTSDDSLAEFLDLTTSVKMMFVAYKEDENLRSSVSFQTVDLSDRMGGVTIQAWIEGYDCAKLSQCGQELEEPANFSLRGHLRLLLVPERTLVPPSASILNHPDNQVIFFIEGGSGRFAVRGSSPSIAKVEYKGKSEVLVMPRSEGMLTISVYDLCLDSMGPAIAHVQISDVYGVDVAVVNKIEIYSEEMLRLQLLDVLGTPLLLGSLKFLTLTPQFSPDILNIRHNVEVGESNKANQDVAFFTVRGMSLGTASLTFTASALGKGSATSAPRDIQVFAPLRLDPRIAVLVRGTTFQVRSTGGPSPQAATLFEVANQTVATVSSVGLVEAQELGTTNLTGFVQASDPLKGQTFLFSKDVIIIRVIQLSGVKINVATTNLVTETKISMYAIGLNDETPFTFANAIPGLKFYWSSSNPDVCQVQSVYALSGVAVESENDFRVDLHCINPGQTTVQLRVEIADHRYQQAHSLALLEDDVTFEVYERLQLIFPASGFLLLPNNVNTKIKTNRDGSGSITYELITDCSQRTMGFNGPSVLTISKGGQVTSASLSGTAAVLVTVHEEFGINQTAVVHVEVKAVSSLTITCQSPVRANSDKLQSFPLGMNVLFSVTLHDNIGRAFSVATIPLKYRLNRFDAVHVVPGPENGTFYARAMNLGEAVLKVWDPSAVNIADYIRIRIGHGLSPIKATLLLGTVQQFSTSIVSEGVGGSWLSSNSRVVHINSTTGVAMAMATGTATIYYRIPNLYSAQTEVKVESLGYIRIEKSDSLVITNLPRPDGRGYVIPITLGHDHLSVEETSMVSGLGDGLVFFQEAMPFTCMLSSEMAIFGRDNPDHFFEVKPGMINGKPMCYIIPKDQSPEAIRATCTSTAQLMLRVRVLDEIQGGSIASEAVRLPFVPAFMVNMIELELSVDQPDDVIVVTGIANQLSNIEVRSLDGSLIDVTPKPPRADTQEYKVAVAGDNLKSFKKIGVEFRSKLTGQIEVVYVSYTSPYGGGAIPVLYPGATLSNQPCPPSTSSPSDGSIRTLFLALLGQTSAWIIGFSIFIGFLILALVLCCSPRNTRGVPTSGRQGPGSGYTSPYRTTPPDGSPYGQISNFGSYSGGRALQSTVYGSPGDASNRSHPEENEDPGLVTYRRTAAASRTYLSDGTSQVPGSALSLGRTSPTKSPGLFSVTQ